MPEFHGAAEGTGRRIAVVVARFNETITQQLLEGALDALTRHGVAFADIDTLWVPGAWEIPFAARRALASDRYDALVALGAVIRGETPHFDFVAGECARSLSQASAELDFPIAFGVLTCDTMEQAEAPCVRPPARRKPSRSRTGARAWTSSRTRRNTSSRPSCPR